MKHVEEWHEIPNFPNFYISKEGDFYRKSHKHTDSLGRVYTCGDIFLKHDEISITNNGYKSIRVGRGKDRRSRYVHRILAQLFIPNPENKSEVNHIDGDKLNNSLTNLEWVTRSENILHSMYVLKNEEDRKIAFGTYHRGRRKSKEHRDKIRQGNIRTKSIDKKPNNKCVICEKECKNNIVKTCSADCLKNLKSQLSSGENNGMYGKTPYNKRGV